MEPKFEFSKQFIKKLDINLNTFTYIEYEIEEKMIDNKTEVYFREKDSKKKQFKEELRRNMVLLIDTNVIIDVAIKRTPFYEDSKKNF